LGVSFDFAERVAGEDRFRQELGGLFTGLRSDFGANRKSSCEECRTECGARTGPKNRSRDAAVNWRTGDASEWVRIERTGFQSLSRYDLWTSSIARARSATVLCCAKCLGPDDGEADPGVQTSNADSKAGRVRRARPRL